MTKSGFTLIELSIVLVIIGLITSAILVGSNLVRGSELRAVIADTERFNTAVHTFKTKYDCLPGDCINATTLFGTDAGGCAAGTIASGTCNGNGDGRIGEFGDTIGWVGAERFLAWQQLQLAGLIAGNYSGTSDSHDMGWLRASVVGWNIPASKIEGAGYLIVYTTLIPPAYSTASINARWQSTGHWIFFGNPLTDPYGSWPIQWYEPTGPTMATFDAKGIDMKLDDGLPNLGRVLTIYTDRGYPRCVDISSGTPAYAVNADDQTCSLQFKASF